MSRSDLTCADSCTQAVGGLRQGPELLLAREVRGDGLALGQWSKGQHILLVLSQQDRDSWLCPAKTKQAKADPVGPGGQSTWEPPNTHLLRDPCPLLVTSPSFQWAVGTWTPGTSGLGPSVEGEEGPKVGCRAGKVGLSYCPSRENSRQ